MFFLQIYEVVGSDPEKVLTGQKYLTAEPTLIIGILIDNPIQKIVSLRSARESINFIKKHSHLTLNHPFLNLDKVSY